MTMTYRAFAAVLLTSVIATSALADTPRDIARRVSPSVVLLVMEDANGQPLAMGSGFVVREGVIATNLHVIEGAARGYAKMVDQKTKYDIKGVVASDRPRDLVLLAVDGVKAAPLIIADSNQVAVGDEVYAVGNPRGLEGTFSAGIVSSVRKVGEDMLLQVTAPISPGSSGGPVVNSKGEVVGVAVATFQGGQNLNFAIPSRYLSALIPSIKAAVALADARKPTGTKKETSILDGLGGRSTEGVEGGQFLWYSVAQIGHYSFSLRNQLREPVKNVVCLLVFYGNDGKPVDASLVTFEGVILPGLAKRLTGNVDGSVQKMTTAEGSDAPRTKLEFRVLYFDIVRGDEPSEKRSDSRPGQAPIPQPEVTKRPDRTSPATDPPMTQEQLDAKLAELEKRMAELAAKIAPAGSGPELIESRIDGEFEGWEGDTIFKLENGQIWRQVTMGFTYHYAFRPKVWIIKTYGAYKMHVDRVSNTIFVKRLK